MDKCEIKKEQIDRLMGMIWQAKEKPGEQTWVVDLQAAYKIIKDWFSNGCDCMHVDEVSYKCRDDDIIYIRECRLCGRKQYATIEGKTIWSDNLSDMIAVLKKEEKETL